MARHGAARWKQVAALIARLGLVTSDPDTSTTATQVQRMPLRKAAPRPRACGNLLPRLGGLDGGRRAVTAISTTVVEQQ